MYVMAFNLLVPQDPEACCPVLSLLHLLAHRHGQVGGTQSESSLGPVDDSKSVRSSAVDVEDVVEKLQEDPRRC